MGIQSGRKGQGGAKARKGKDERAERESVEEAGEGGGVSCEAWARRRMSS